MRIPGDVVTDELISQDEADLEDDATPTGDTAAAIANVADAPPAPDADAGTKEPAAAGLPSPTVDLVAQLQAEVAQERELRLRTEGMLAASQRKPEAAAPAPEVGEEAAKAAQEQLYLKSVEWIQGTENRPGIIQAAAARHPLSPERATEIYNTLIESPEKGIAMIDALVNERAAAALAEYHAQAAPAFREMAKADVKELLRELQEESGARTQVQEAFDRMYDEMVPHVHAFWQGLPDTFKSAFADHAGRVADEIAAEISGNEHDRISLIAAVRAGGRQDIEDAYLMRVGKRLEADYNIVASPENGKVAAATPARPKGNPKRAGGITPSARQPVPIERDDDREDNDPISSIERGREEFGI